LGAFCNPENAFLPDPDAISYLIFTDIHLGLNTEKICWQLNEQKTLYLGSKNKIFHL